MSSLVTQQYFNSTFLKALHENIQMMYATYTENSALGKIFRVYNSDEFTESFASAESTTVAAAAILSAAFKMGAVQRGEYLTNVPTPTSAGGVSVPSPMMTQAADYSAYRAGERATNVTLESY